MSEFFAVSQLVNKNHSSTFHGIMFLFHTVITGRDFFTFQFKDWKQRTTHENTLLVQSET